MEINDRRVPAETTSSSVLQADEKFYNRVISRDSSVSSSVSSRVFYSRAAAEGGVPFNWETQPGTPKNNPEEERIPPIGLPPAVLSLSLPKPRSVMSDDPKGDGDGGGGGFNVRKFKLLWKFFVGKGRSMKRRRRWGLHQPQVLV